MMALRMMASMRDFPRAGFRGLVGFSRRTWVSQKGEGVALRALRSESSGFSEPRDAMRVPRGS